MRPSAALWFGIGAFASLSCAGIITGQEETDEVVGQLTLSDDALATELRDSPAHESKVAFWRIGGVWDADRPGAIEISTSSDGASWSNWLPLVVHHIEVERTASFSGLIEIGDEANHFYRLRAGNGTASFVHLELLAKRTAEAIANGETPPAGTARDYKADQVGLAEVHSRDEWGAQPTRCTAPLGNPYRITIHNTETPNNDSLSPQARLRQIQSYHQDTRGWCDIGYHYLASPDGRLWEGVPVNFLGTHTANNNTGNIGIAAIGDYGQTPLGDAPENAIATLVAGLTSIYSIPVSRSSIKGHREWTSTDCPGDALYAQLNDLVNLAQMGGGDNFGGGGSGSVTVQGIVYAGSDPTNVIVGATVTLGGTTVTTDSFGQWEFDNVQPGPFTVMANAPGYLSAAVNRVTSGAVTWASLGLSPQGATSGTAILQGIVYETTSTSNRIPWAWIGLSTGQAMSADSNGFYQFTDLPAGDVTLTVAADGYDTSVASRTLSDGRLEWGDVRLMQAGGGGGGGGIGGGSVGANPESQWTCSGSVGQHPNASGEYYITTFGCWTDSSGNAHSDPGDNCEPYCQYEAGWDALCGGLSGAECERTLNWYTADAHRFGCGSRLRVTNPNNGRSAVLAVIDSGPSCSIESRVNFWVLDLSMPAALYLYGEDKSATERAEVQVEVVDSSYSLGPN